jgi:hypothetical protein
LLYRYRCLPVPSAAYSSVPPGTAEMTSNSAVQHQRHHRYCLTLLLLLLWLLPPAGVTLQAPSRQPSACRVAAPHT